ncbi:MAG: hypothetical protein GTO18_22120 [Anaerolineales bacterium]|nr:hypothetical protein [Anaerolineales bacterium]
MDNAPQVRSRIKLPHSSLVILGILILIAIGFAIAGDYGTSWDEYVHTTYAEQSIENYEGTRDPTDTLLNLRYYGPFYSVFVEATKGLFRRINSGWLLEDARHFGYYLSFVVGVVSLYFLCLRFAGRLASFAVSLLFVSQPLLLGHAFINPKDIPFMGFFLASVTLGFYASDILPRGSRERDASKDEGGTESTGFGHRLIEDWRSSQRWLRILLIALLILLVMTILEFFVLNIALNPMQELVTHAYQGTAWAPLNNLFRRIAEDIYKTPLELYIGKLNTAYFLMRWVVVALIALLLILTLRAIYKGPAYKSTWYLLAAGILLGLCTSIRIQGLFSGVLVSFLILVKWRRKGILPLVFYWCVAFVVTYLAWPFLWDAPLRRFTEILQLMSSFGWGGSVLFRGEVYHSFQRPWYHIPYLILIQISLPALLLGLIGVVEFLRNSRRPLLDQVDRLLILLWFILPLVYTILPGMDFYDNFRQMLFIVPPIFVFGSIGLEAVFRLVTRSIWRIVIICILLLQGILGIINLHPYEYTYYNELVGGTGNVYQQFELDYWCTSSREAVEYLNGIAPQNVTVGTNKDSEQIVPYAREDLKIVPGIVNVSSIEAHSPDYVIVCTRSIQDFSYLGDFEEIWQVTKNGAPMATILKLK